MQSSVIIDAIQLGCIVIGGVFSLYQWQKNSKIRRSEFINNLISKFYSEGKLRDTLYRVDQKDWYDDEKFYHSIEEDVDALLCYFDYICYLRELHLITEKEFRFFEYDITQMVCSKSFESYMQNLSKDCVNDVNDLPMPFYSLREYKNEIDERNKR